jgi:hypothetical protein
LDLDLAGLHRLGHFALQFDLEQSILERGALHFDVIREIEATLERPPGNATVEVLGLALLLIGAAGDRRSRRSSARRGLGSSSS